MSERRITVPALLLLLGAALMGSDLSAQSTQDQRVRVADLDAALRESATPVPGSWVSARATDTTRAGALIVRSEPELTALVAPATAHAWRILENTFGNGALALQRIGLVYTLQRGRMEANAAQQTGNELLLVAEIPPSTTSRSGSVPSSPGPLAERIAWDASVKINGEFGSELTLWPRTGAWIETPEMLARRADAFITLASLENPQARGCARNDLSSCRILLGLDAVVPAQPIRQGPQNIWQVTDQAVNREREYFLSLVIRLGGPDAPTRFRSATGRTFGDRLAAAADVPVDTLVRVWRSSVNVQPPQRKFTTQSLAILMVSTVLLLLTTLRSPRVQR